MFPSDKEQLTRKQMIEKKKKLKAMFDAEYDDKEGSSFYDDLKRDLDQQAQVFFCQKARIFKYTCLSNNAKSQYRALQYAAFFL